MPAPNPNLPPFDPARLTPVKRALLSVSDKSRLVDQARELHERGVKLVSTGGTRAAIEKAGIPVKDVSELTNFPEMMDGRCLLYTSPSPRDRTRARMPSSA